jgi:hypothetical protein
MSSSGKAGMARAAMAVLEPLVEMLLEMGVTSPEAESLLRSVFVHRAREWLARLDQGAAVPSDARIALVTGVHRNFVRHILAEPPRIAKARQRKGSAAARLLNAWHSDPQYLDAHGKPVELAEKGGIPSFQSLAGTYLPAAAAGVLLAELKRGGQVQLLPDGRVRVRGRATRMRGLTMESVSEIGERSRELVETMRHNLRDPEAQRPFESMAGVDVEEEALPALRELIGRRMAAFMARLEQEIRTQAEPSGRAPQKRAVRVSLTAFVTENGPEK